MIFRAIRDSIGFMGRHWHEGELTPDITDKETLKHSALARHFVKHDGVIPSDEAEDETLTMRGLALQQTLELMTVAQLKEYAAEHGVDVPGRATKAEILALLD